MVENPDIKDEQTPVALHLHTDGKHKMLHEAASAEERAAILANTKSVASRRHIGQKAVETLTTDLL